MKKHVFSGQLGQLINKAQRGTTEDTESILKQLTPQSSLTTTRNIDYALSLIETDEGVQIIKNYLFNGSLIQRNYCSLFFNRRGDWQFVKQAYDMGLIDEVQAYAR